MMCKCDLMRKIMELDFAIVDISLYLDTHPDDTDMLSTVKKLSKEYDQLITEYELHYGNIIRNKLDPAKSWTWNEGAMPWDGGVN